MSDPADSDWVEAARDIWSDETGDVWIPHEDDVKPPEPDDPGSGVWITGCRVWISRKQLDRYLAHQAGNGSGPQHPVLTYINP